MAPTPGFWKLTGTIYDAIGRPAKHRIRVLLPSSYTDDDGRTITRQLAGRNPYRQYGEFTVWLPENMEAALTVTVEDGPTLYKIIPARTGDVTWETLEASIGDWEAEAGTLPSGYPTVDQVEAMIAAGGGLTNLAETIQDTTAAMIVAGANITKTYDDTAGTLVLAAADAVEPTATISEPGYTPDVPAPESTDLAAVAQYADVAPTFTDPTVFPIMDWATNAEGWSAASILTTTSMSVMMSNHDHARNYGLPGLFMIDGDADGSAGPHEGTVGVETEGWAVGDEWDMRQADGSMGADWPNGAGAIARAQAEAAMVPAGMPVYGNVGKGYLCGPANLATPFAAVTDILSGDQYAYTDPEWSTGGYPQCQYLGLASDAGELARRSASYYLLHKRLRDRLDAPKPTGQVVEVSAQAGVATLQPAQSVGAAWASIIAGATFIIWFYQTPWIAPADPWEAGTTYTWPASVTHDGKTWGTRPQVVSTTGVTPGTDDDVWGEIVQQWIGSYGQGASTQSALAEFKARVTEISTALRSDSLTHTATTGVNTRVVTDGEYTYLIAQPSHAWAGSGTTYTLNFPAGTAAVTADVLWESRAETVTAGAVQDTFSQEHTVHVYRVVNN